MKNILQYLLFCLYFFLIFCGCLSLWTFYNWGTPSVQQTLINLSKIDNISPLIYIKFFIFVVLPACLLSLLPQKVKFILALCSACGACYVFNLIPYLLNKNTYSNLYENDFVKIDVSKIDTPQLKKNLIVIYVESLEKQYGDADFCGEVLTPFIQSQKDKELSFEGYHQLKSNKYTLAAIMASQCGFLDSILLSKTQVGLNFRSQLPCISDILSHQGYKTFFYQSADIDFADTLIFLQQHHFDFIRGKKDWIDLFGDDQTIFGGSWGVRDYFIYKQAQNTILEMEKSNQNYALFLSTIETHGDENFVDFSCPFEGHKKADIVKCADYMLKDFINWCQRQAFYNNMTIVVLGDHTAHGFKNFLYQRQPAQRQIENIWFNSALAEQQPHQWTTFDLAPTILEAIGYDMPALGLGRSLFKKEKTAFEIYGSKMDIMLEQKSHFLEDNIYPVSTKQMPYLSLQIGKIYRTAEELKSFIPFSYHADYQLGRLWLQQLNLQVENNKSYMLKINAIAVNNGKNRLFDVWINHHKITTLTFDVKQLIPQNFEIKIPSFLTQDGQIDIMFLSSDIPHWNMTTLGIGIDEISLYQR